MFDISGLNWLAVLAATVAGFMLGGLWYGPLFGKAWLAAIKPSPTPFVVSFFTALITSVVLAVLIRSLGISSMSGGIFLGCLTGVGFIATAMASDSAFCGWGGQALADPIGLSRHLQYYHGDYSGGMEVISCRLVIEGSAGTGYIFAHWIRVTLPSLFKKASPFPFRASAPFSSMMTLLSVLLLTRRANWAGRFDLRFVLITSALGFCVAMMT